MQKCTVVFIINYHLDNVAEIIQSLPHSTAKYMEIVSEYYYCWISIRIQEGLEMQKLSPNF